MFPGPQIPGGPLFPGPPEVKIGGFPIFPGSPEVKIGGFPIFPSSPESKIGRFPIFYYFQYMFIGFSNINIENPIKTTHFYPQIGGSMYPVRAVPSPR